MLKLNPSQHQKLHDIAEAIKTTDYGQAWPPEYSELFRLWGFFNSIYDTLYKDPKEWQRISRFALDSRFNHIWNVLAQRPAAQELARQPCVGNGRNGYAPSQNIRIAFHTLRSNFGINLQDVCQSSKCQSRQQRNIPICLSQNWPAAPQALANPEDAKFAPFGATLLIIYQIRSNLFHGSKREIHGPDYVRNQLLVQFSSQITRLLLEETRKLLP
jgi:hypothetical protein